ncbi:MAG: hypothetical protein CFE21_17440 [Bacteroidetes bacterium B1(2017)]|nr:MAG: hypothetical protein CFE21_17440 [Bacteroidetes bacterium B1(2017)]
MKEFIMYLFLVSISLNVKGQNSKKIVLSPLPTKNENTLDKETSITFLEQEADSILNLISNKDISVFLSLSDEKYVTVLIELNGTPYLLKEISKEYYPILLSYFQNKEKDWMACAILISTLDISSGQSSSYIEQQDLWRNNRLEEDFFRIYFLIHPTFKE